MYDIVGRYTEGQGSKWPHAESADGKYFAVHVYCSITHISGQAAAHTGQVIGALYRIMQFHSTPSDIQLGRNIDPH